MRIVFECLNLQVYMRTAHVVPRDYIQQQNWWFGSRRTNKCKHCWTLLQRELEWNSILKSYNAEIMCRKTLFWQSSLWEDLPWKRQRQNHMEPLHWHFTECLTTRALIGKSTPTKLATRAILKHHRCTNKKRPYLNTCSKRRHQT